MWLRPRKISIRIHDGVRDQTNTVIKTWVGPSRAVAENLKNSSCRKLVLNHLYAFDGMGSLGLKALFFLAKNGHAWDHGPVFQTKHYVTLLCLLRARLRAGGETASYKMMIGMS